MTSSHPPPDDPAYELDTRLAATLRAKQKYVSITPGEYEEIMRRLAEIDTIKDVFSRHVSAWVGAFTAEIATSLEEVGATLDEHRLVMRYWARIPQTAVDLVEDHLRELAEE